MTIVQECFCWRLSGRLVRESNWKDSLKGDYAGCVGLSGAKEGLTPEMEFFIDAAGVLAA
jgi:hypothetical protein